MSRIGKRIINIPETNEVEFVNNIFKVKGPLGELSREIPLFYGIKIHDHKLSLSIIDKKDDRHVKILYGTMNSLINNMVLGVNKKFEKELEIVGIGYRARLDNGVITLKLGFSHDVIVKVPLGIDIEIQKLTKIFLKSIDKAKVGAFAAKIRAYRPPEPYLGKGIRYKDEKIIRKEGKKAGKGK